MLAPKTEISTATIEDQGKKLHAQEQHQQTCLHCGLPSNGEQFCCIGCKSIYQTIHELGLQHFYDLRQDPWKPNASQLAPESLQALDYPELLSTYFTVTQDKYLKGTLILEGIHCAGCVWMLEELQKIIPGVQSSRVDMGQGLLFLIFNPEITKLSNVAKAINRLGYSVTMTKKEAQGHRKDLVRLGIAAICAANTMMLAVSLWQGLFTQMASKYSRLFLVTSFFITLPCITYAGLPFYRNAFFSLRRGRFHIDLPLSIALLGAFLASSINMILGRNTVYFDSVCLLTFLLLSGRYVQSRALAKAQTRTKTAWSVLPSSARIVQNETYTIVVTDSVLPGSCIEVRTGERVPVDGILKSGKGLINRSVLTGESDGFTTTVGDLIEASTELLEGTVQIQTTSLPRNSRIHKILSQLEHTPDSQLKIYSLTERLSVWFVGVVLSLAVCTFSWWAKTSLTTAVDNTVALLIVSCPCALGIALPLIIARANATLAAHGILIKRSSALESLILSKHLYIDKTGTLTTGNLQCLSSVLDLSDLHKSILSTLVFHASTHPITRALRKVLLEHHSAEPHSIDTVIGKGAKLSFKNGTSYYLGSKKWFESFGGSIIETAPQTKEFSSSVLFWSVALVNNSKHANLITEIFFQDQLREGVQEFFALLTSRGIVPTILSGDSLENCSKLIQQHNVKGISVLAQLSPEEKAAIVKKDAFDTIMIGDGINDTLALKNATVGIGFRGSLEASADSCDIYLQSPSYKELCFLFDYAARIRTLIKKTIYIGTGYNLLFAPLAVLGYINPVIAAFVMPLSSISVITISILGTAHPKAKR